MNDLLFSALTIVLLYYFFIYLPQQKKLTATNPPGQQQQATQTDPLANSPELTELKTKNQELTTEIKNQQKQITQLQSEIRNLVKRPVKPTNSKTTQTDDKSWANTLDTLIKSVQELNNSLN